MKAPDRIWITPSIDLPRLNGVMDKNSVEYVHTDAFIEKACDFMRNNIDKQLTIYHNNTWRKRDEFIEAFKQFIKGE